MNDELIIGPANGGEMVCFGDAVDSKGEITEFGKLLNSPDCRVELDGGVPVMIYAIGCRTCQNLRSKCMCQVPVFTEQWVYNRTRGVLRVPMLSTVTGYRPATRLTEYDIKRLLPKSEKFDGLSAESDAEQAPQKRFEMLDTLNPKLIEMLEKHLVSHNVKPVKLSLSFPEEDRKDLETFFEEKGQVFPKDAESIDSGARGGTTVRRAASAIVLLPYPDIGDESMFQGVRVERVGSGGFTCRASNIRFALKLLIEYPHLVAFHYTTPKDHRGL